ncbi:TlpA family protein disulfide reductase [Roseospira navarrensis]|uniref:Redoxin family protein n=1 Tax=Roseospira navarrensis TaxID=140058 RepID=A0A7X2D4H1_9PROT|nr:TlpA family protein disulfide reductase [Roseospira navarrensis]MQX36607.1 redoxin family protein [Roseospira navarrensis]
MSRNSTRSGPLVALAVFVIGLAAIGGTAVAPRLLGMPMPGSSEGGGGGSPLTLSAAAAPVQGAPFRNQRGDTVTLDAFRGKVVVLNFWATWCGPCVREMPALDRLQATLGGPRFEVVAVSVDQASMDTLRGFYRQTGVETLALYHDPGSALAGALKVSGLPTTVILDHEGRELARHMGYMDWDHRRFVDWFKRRISEIR